ncbi:MAG TPA: tetratricopeptide repeat protein [Hyphomicrobiaceae bacterium]|nr:tetratricopeptide repeat protein [Hyphomicrobiaceae bacterium]
MPRRVLAGLAREFPQGRVLWRMLWPVPLLLALPLILLLASALAEDTAAIRDAGAALARGNLDQAVALYSQALQDKTLANERRAILLSDRGVAHARLQNPREAIEDFNRAVQLFPEYAAIYNNRGNVLLGIGAVREAMKDFDRALLLAPGYAAAYSNRAGAQVRLGEVDLAVADYTKAISLVPTSPAALTGRGRAHLAARRPQTAIRDLTRAINLDARFSAAYRARAEAKMVAAHYDEAIEDFSRAIAFEARNAELYLLRGDAYLAANNAASAAKDFSTAIDISPRNARAWAARGLAYAKADAYEDALNDLGRAIELEPRSAKAFAYRAWTYRKQQPELGLKDVERALKLDPNSAEAYWARGEIAEARGQPVEAAVDIAKALALDPRLKDAQAVQHRLRPSPLADVEEEVGDAGFDRWRVFVKWPQYVATNDQFPKLKVDIEMLGKGRPRILDWEVKAAPFAGIGVLRFQAGVADGPRGPEEIEQAAIVDVQAGSVVAVETVRRGAKQGQLTWDAGKLVVASADGTTDELALRSEKPKEAAPPKRVAAEKKDVWSPWGSTWDGGKKRPKTLFELLFGN